MENIDQLIVEKGMPLMEELYGPSTSAIHDQLQKAGSDIGHYGLSVIRGGTRKLGSRVLRQLARAIIKSLGDHYRFDDKKMEFVPLNLDASKNASPSESEKKIPQVFLSYHHEDQEFVEKLRVHFSWLIRKGEMELLYDENILLPGDEINERIKSAIARADVLIPLVSPNYLASDYNYELEWRDIQARANDGSGVVILPIVVRPCFFEGAGFGKFTVLPRGGKPVSHWKDPDEAYLSIVKSIKEILDKKAGETISRSIGMQTKGFSSAVDRIRAAHQEGEHKTVLDLGPEFLASQKLSLLDQGRICLDVGRSALALEQKKEAIDHFMLALEKVLPLGGPAAAQIKVEIFQQLVGVSPRNAQYWFGMAEAYGEMGATQQRDDAYNTAEKIKAEQDYRDNLRRDIRLYQLRINRALFFRDIEWNLQPQVNILLGKNGYGKSFLLNILLCLLKDRNEMIYDILSQGQSESIDPLLSVYLEKGAEPYVIRRNLTAFLETIGEMPILAIPDVRSVDKSQDTIVSDLYIEDLVKEGAQDFMHSRPIGRLINQLLSNLVEYYRAADETFSAPIFNLMSEVIKSLTGNKVFEFVEIRTTSRSRSQLMVRTENSDLPLPFQRMSQGTTSVLVIFGLIYEYLEALGKYRGSELPPQEETGIVVIDEVDAHLHPEWQRKIVGLLREHFPNVQFLITAHSPLVVGGCLDGEVSVLRKEGKEAFTVEQFEGDFIGWQSQEIYNKIFQIEEMDRSFLHYHSLYAFRHEIKAEIDELEGKSDLTDKESARLEKLYDDEYYIKKAHQKAQDLNKEEQRQIGNQILEQKLNQEKEEEKEKPRKEGVSRGSRRRKTKGGQGKRKNPLI